MTYPNACCNDPDNLSTIQDEESMTVRECRVCGCKHYEVTVDPVELGVTGEGL